MSAVSSHEVASAPHSPRLVSRGGSKAVTVSLNESPLSLFMEFCKQTKLCYNAFIPEHGSAP